MKLKDSDSIDVKNIITVLQLRPELQTQIVRDLIAQIEKLKEENKLLLDEILKVKGE